MRTLKIAKYRPTKSRLKKFIPPNRAQKILSENLSRQKNSYSNFFFFLFFYKVFLKMSEKGSLKTFSITYL